MNPLDARRRLLGRNVYKKTVEGNPAIAQGSLARRYPGITMQGWTEQNGTPTPEAPVPIVSAGTQNQDTGKWEYEITIANAQTDATKNQTVTLTSDRPLTKWDKLEKRNGQWGWVYKSIEITLDGRENWIPYPDFGGYRTNLGFLPFSDNRRTGFSEVAFIGYRTDAFSIWLGANNSILYVAFAPQYDPELEDMGIENWKNWLSEKPMKILTYADGETFIPLSAEEQEQMNALHTYYPTTVLSNDCGCNMTLTYKAKKSLEVAT